MQRNRAEQPHTAGSGVLSGIRVLDLATLAAAPWTAAYLGEFGADVIKVEYPGRGDHSRSWGSHKDGQAVFWKSISRNKRSITLNLKKEAGAEILKRLVRTTDVVVENFRPGTLQRWGVGYDELADANPRLVMLHVTGFGQTGPYRDRAGFGTLAEGMSGFAHLNGMPDGPPILPNFPLADGTAGLTGAYAVMLALYQRDVNGGRGQEIDVSLYEPLLRLLEPSLMDYDQLGVARERVGSRSDHVAPRNAYRCGDGTWASVSCSADRIFDRLARAMGKPELLEDDRFATNAQRLRNVDALDAIIGAWFEARPRAEVIEVLGDAGVAVAPIYAIPDVFDDPHVGERESFCRLADPDFGPMRLVNVVPRLSATPGRVTSTGPALGAHNEEIYGELGLSDAELARLAREGVI